MFNGGYGKELSKLYKESHELRYLINIEDDKDNLIKLREKKEGIDSIIISLEIEGFKYV